MEQKIYILVDSDGETHCAFVDKEIAIKEALEAGCDVEEITLHS